MKKLFTTLGIIFTVAGTSITMATATPPHNTIPNEACIKYTVNGVDHTECDSVNITYHNDQYACLSISSAGTVVQLDENDNGEMQFTCRATDGNKHDFTIYCGNGLTGTASGVSSFSYNCKYGPNDTGKTLDVSCYVDNEEPTNPACIKNISIGYGIYGECGNGMIEPGEDCDLWLNVNNVWNNPITINGRLDLTLNHYTHEYDGNLCRNCKIISGGNFVYEPAECLYTDTPISVMNNEIMPFWWRLWIKDTQKVDDYDSCSDYHGDKTLLLDDDDHKMKCYFAVYNGKHKQGDADEIQKFETDCFNDNFSNSEYLIYKYFKEQHQTKADGASISTVNAITNHVSERQFGEYKLVLEKVEYQYCKNGIWTQGRRYGAICEVNFAITKPYIMQISTFGVSPIAATDEGGFLEDFYDMQGNRLLNSTDLSDVMNVSNSTYATGDVQDEINKFRDKYAKLAVKINRDGVRDLFGAGDYTVKKVPNQHIYFIEKGSDDTLVFTQDEIKRKTSAYTIFVSGMDVEIQGDVLQYAMIITTEHMSFKDAGPDRTRRNMFSKCANGGQVVQGLYVAGKGFKQGDELRNREPEEYRCPWGGLHVKGALIGGGINNIKKGKRSQLNSWFNVASVSQSDKKVKQERRKKIIEGAAVLIEYSPSLWKTLPPGAEIFTKSLEIYRK